MRFSVTARQTDKMPNAQVKIKRRIVRSENCCVKADILETTYKIQNEKILVRPSFSITNLRYIF